MIPTFLKEKLINQYNEDITEEIISSFNQDKVVSLRINTIKTTKEEILNILKENNYICDAEIGIIEIKKRRISTKITLFDINKNDHVIVETARGVEYGAVVLAPKEVEEEAVVQPLKSVIRPASLEDDEMERINKEKEREAFTICLEKIRKKKQEECVVNMLKIMSETGKLVRISELDMGYVDKDGNSLKTTQLTEEQHKAMAKFYTFIVEKYLEIVPAAQQYGICQWCLTDSPEDSSWRKGEPVGLWDRSYNRKHTYGGFADGLK